MDECKYNKSTRVYKKKRKLVAQKQQYYAPYMVRVGRLIPWDLSEIWAQSTAIIISKGYVL